MCLLCLQREIQYLLQHRSGMCILNKFSLKIFVPFHFTRIDMLSADLDITDGVFVCRKNLFVFFISLKNSRH